MNIAHSATSASNLKSNAVIVCYLLNTNISNAIIILRASDIDSMWITISNPSNSVIDPCLLLVDECNDCSE